MNIHLHCPHCQSPIELVDFDAGHEVVCTSCGSSFRLASDSTAAWLPSGKTVGRFELVQQVGHGAFGTVYKARDPQLDRTVAIKVPRRGNVGDGPQDFDRFLHEARSVAQLRHPAIVTVHEVGSHDGTPYLVSDFVEGVTLADLLTTRRPAPREAARLIADLAEALHYAHSQGVVHRDVKPSNVMLEKGPEHLLPRLMDFGLAKREAGEITMTIDGEVLGTPAYMSPEQARGEGRQVDGRSDLYSLGVILYQLLTGELPFRGNTRMLLNQVLHDEPRSPRSLNDHIPRDLETITLKAMAKEPGRRYATARDLADDLRRFLNGEPIQARPVGRAERLGRWCRRNPLVASLSAAIALVLLAGVALSTCFALAMRAQRDRVRAEKETADEQRQIAQQAQLQESSARRLAELRLAETYLEKGRGLSQRGEASQGAHWFVRSLEVLPAGSDDLAVATRANLAMWRRNMLSLSHCCSHKSQVTDLIFSRDGTAVLTASFDRSARLWDAATLAPRGPPLPHPHQVECAALAPDGQTVLTGCFDGTLRLFNGRTGVLLSEPLAHGTVIRSVVFQPDGPLALARNNSGHLLLFDTRTGMPAPVQVAGGQTISTQAFSRDGKLILTGTYRNPVAQLWDVATGEPVGDSLLHEKGIELVAFSPDGQTFFTASDLVRRWDTATRSPIEPPLLHASIRDIAFSANGKTIATASNDTTVRLWNAATGRLLVQPIAHTNQVSQVAFTPDGLAIVSSSAGTGGVARLWDAATGEPLSQALPDTGQVAISPDGATLVVGGLDGQVRAWQFDRGAPVDRMLPHTALIRTAAFSLDGKTVLTGGQDNVARLWSTTTGKIAAKPLEHKGVVEAVAFSPDGETVVTGSWDKTLRLWIRESGEPLGLPMEHTGPVHLVMFTPDGNLVVSGGGDKAVRFWNAQTGLPDGAAIENPTTVRALALSGDGRLLLVGSWRGAAFLWNLESRKRLGPDLAHEKADATVTSVDALAFSPDGQTVATGGNDNMVRLWEAATGQPRGSPLRHRKSITGVAFSPAGKLVLSASWDGTARLWNASTGEAVGRALRHDDAVLASAFSPDGRWILTGSDDNTAQLWHAATCEPVGPPIEHRGEVSVVAFSADGQTFLTGSGAVRVSSVSLVEGTPQQLAAWVALMTGLEIGGDGTVTPLPVDQWQARKKRFAALNLAPLPPHVAPLSELRKTKQREPGPFGRSSISGG